KIGPGGSNSAAIIIFTALSNKPVKDTLNISNNSLGVDSVFGVQLFGAGKFPHLTVSNNDSAKFGMKRIYTTKSLNLTLKNTGTDSLTFTFYAQKFYLPGAGSFSDSGSSFHTLKP